MEDSVGAHEERAVQNLDLR